MTRFLAEHGPDFRLMLEQLFANRISGFFALEVVVTSIVLWVFVFTEGRRQQGLAAPPPSITEQRTKILETNLTQSSGKESGV